MQLEYYFDIETVSKKEEDCSPECTANLSPETGKIATIQFQRLDTLNGNPIGNLEILKEWDSTEGDIIEKFKDLIKGHPFKFIPIGHNLSFDFKFLYAKLKEYFPDIEFTPFYFWYDRAHLDIKPIIVILNNGSFSGAKLSRFTKKDENGKFIRKDGSIIYDKNPLAKAVPISYFKDTVIGQIKITRRKLKKSKQKVHQPLCFPSENETIDICKNGEDQFNEFKRSGTPTENISREIQAFAVTKNGGFIFYGVEDNGKIKGTDLYKQKFDERIQNSIRNTITPVLNVEIKSIKVAGTEILIIRIPPWNREDVYQFHDGKTYIRKGGNSFPAKPNELKKLHYGEYAV